MVKPKLKGYAGIVNYADDFVVCFQYKGDAELFYGLLKHRMVYFGLGLAEDMHRKIGMMRTQKTADIIKWINQVLVGYYHYNGVIGNYDRVIGFRWNILRSLFYWLNRRSQKKSYTWSGFYDMVDKGLPVVRPKSFYVYIS